MCLLAYLLRFQPTNKQSEPKLNVGHDVNHKPYTCVPEYISQFPKICNQNSLMESLYTDPK